MGKGLKAGLMALTALATIAPATAQENGGWRGRGMERQGDRHADGNAPAPQHNWRDNGGAQQPQHPRADAPRADPRPEGARPMDHQWNGQRNAPWQPRDPSVARPPPVPTDGRYNRPDGYGQATGQPGGQLGHGWDRNGRPDDAGINRDNRPPAVGWQNRDRGNGHDDARDRARDRERVDSNRWDDRGYGRENGRGPGWNDQGRDDRRPQPAYGNGGWQNQHGWQHGGRLNAHDRWRDQQRWSNDWRRDDRYDWSRYRQSNRSAYRMPSYRPPSGWSRGYSRFSIGLFLGGPLYSNSYWIDDPYSYRLPPAYGTLRWIRYYDDALLVDIRDGYVVDVIHSFFW